MNQIIMWIMAVGAVLGGVDRIAGNRFGLGKRFEEGFTLLGPTALSMSGIICLTPLLSRFLRFALVPIWNFLGLDAGLLAGILAIDMGGYQLAGELSASQEMVRYAGLVIAATLGCTITFTIPVGMGMLKSGDRLFFSRGMLIGTGTLPVTMIVGGLLSGLSFLQIVLQSLPVLLFCFLLMFGIWRFPEQTVRAFTVFADVIRLTVVCTMRPKPESATCSARWPPTDSSPSPKGGCRSSASGSARRKRSRPNSDMRSNGSSARPPAPERA